MCFGTLIGPIILCAKQFNSLLPRYREWQAEAANPSANVAELAAEARSLWLGITKVYYLDGIVFTSECCITITVAKIQLSNTSMPRSVVCMGSSKRLPAHSSCSRL